MKCNLVALDHRLPITELSVVAPLLDPSQRNLASVQEYVTSNGITAVELLTRAINRYVDEDDNRSENASVDEATDRPSHSAEPAWKKTRSAVQAHQICAKRQQRNPTILLSVNRPRRYSHLVEVCYRDLSKAS